MDGLHIQSKMGGSMERLQERLQEVALNVRSKVAVGFDQRCMSSTMKIQAMKRYTCLFTSSSGFFLLLN